MKVQFKITTWEEFDISDHIEEEILTKIKSGEITTGNQIFDQYEEDKDFEFTPNLENSETYITPEQNGGWATIEVVNNIANRYTDPIIYTNEIPELINKNK